MSPIPDEASRHSFEILQLEKAPNGCWLAQFAIDGKSYPSFYEPCENVYEMSTEEFIAYMQLQALTMAGYWQQKWSND